MFRLNRVHSAALAACGGILLANTTFAQGAPDVQRVEITGSAIKRISAEGSLPVQVINAEAIQRSGANSVAEALAKLPAMQGFQIPDIAIGTNSGGNAFASLHDIGADYTLVLLNGRRIAPTGSGSTVNLWSIPMSAIERIEILTDGASALYGSDAIAGVINFVLKRHQQGGKITLKASVPEKSGGAGGQVDISYGLGNLDTDRFSLVGTFSHAEQKSMKATQRDFASTAYKKFSFNGTNYVYDRTSAYAVPANASLTFNKASGLPAYAFNPYQKKNGDCAPMNFYSLGNASSATSVTENCAFDFVQTIDIVPEYKHDALYLSGQFKVSDGLKFFADAGLTRIDLTARIAPNPVPVTIAQTSDAFKNYVAPYLTATQLANIATVSANYRAVDFGTRNSQTISDSSFLVFGAEGDIGNWYYNTAVTHSKSQLNEKYVGGYFRADEFTTLIKSGSVNPFLTPGQQSAATMDAIGKSIYNGSIRKASTTQTGIDGRISGEIAKLPAGALNMAVGADYRRVAYKSDPSDDALNGVIYNYAPGGQYDLKRNHYGAFVEFQVPVIKGLELTAAARYDKISAIDDAGKTVGQSMDASTYKLSGRYQVTPQVVLRGSYGTGFKAPSMLDIAQPLVSAGVTAKAYDCPFPGTDYCQPGKFQYSVQSGGNALLKPEKSDQATFGILVEPTRDIAIKADYWQVNLRDAVSSISEALAFADPNKYRDLFMLYQLPAQTQQYWTFISASTNIGQAINRGIDYDIDATMRTDFGRLRGQFGGTHLLKSSYTIPGSTDFTDSMNHFGVNNAVSFRNLWRASLELQTGNWSHEGTLRYRNGYLDQTVNARNLTTGKIEKVTLTVPDYYTFDWMTKYQFNKALEFRAVVKNVFGKKPPLSLRESSGHQVGYDARYHDMFGRTWQLQASYAF